MFFWSVISNISYLHYLNMRVLDKLWSLKKYLKYHPSKNDTVWKSFCKDLSEQCCIWENWSYSRGCQSLAGSGARFGKSQRGDRLPGDHLSWWDILIWNFLYHRCFTLDHWKLTQSCLLNAKCQRLMNNENRGHVSSCFALKRQCCNF